MTKETKLAGLEAAYLAARNTRFAAMAEYRIAREAYIAALKAAEKEHENE